ncbi:DMT family transporter [Vibrio tubiashii]|uniref:DMT family transporter n=1 Tax=Vibrio oreintalis group TaxID=1891919 RepID=UPI001EFCF3A1|nr:MULTISPECIES: DMT family transporter [Vibrio oreintalis group]MCG9578505.1 DMT family transporter [Vibrio tubiashii]MCG9583501.1 DMT family transporter [Vibrio tubiashii]MCG9617078.1 DMT family transporter [Vibrio tubiashii]MCG9686215.1 DMT family transporter [Vibrio tubiashii]MCG9753331.1 DMT family transporter [Vibrio brasiliensis]
MLRSDRERGTIEMVIAMLLSGTIGYFVLSSEQPFWHVVFFRCLIGAGSLLVYMLITQSLRFPTLEAGAVAFILLGGVTLVGNWVLLFASFAHVPFSIATIAYHMQPILLVILSAFLSHQLPSRHIIFWLLMAVIGLGLVVGLSPRELWHMMRTDSLSVSLFWGVILALGAAMLYAITTLLTKHVSHIPSPMIALIHVLTGCVLLLPMVDFQHLPTEAGQWGDLLVLGTLNTGVLYILLYSAFQKLTTTLIAALSFIYPVTALVVDYFAFGHAVNVLQVTGIVLILLAVCAVKFNWKLSRLMPGCALKNDSSE